jgi:prepilin-type N-terminal cleavage/methylation domain-containing protein
MRRRGYSLLEILIALAIGSGILAVGMQALVVLRKGEVEAEARSARAIRQARLLETLLRDLRSSVEVEAQGPGQLRIRRYVLLGDRIDLKEVRWSREGEGDTARLLRSEDGGPGVPYELHALAEEGYVAQDLRIERVRDVLFIP